MARNDWLLTCEPREAQVEALRRSHLGECLYDEQGGEPNPRPVIGHPRSEPAKGWGHFLEMRVGKTPVHLNEGALLRRDYDIRWHVVLSPNAFKRDWGSEAEKFGYPADAHVFESKDRRAAQRFVDKRSRTGGLIAINYEALGSDETLSFLEDLMGPQTLIGADESITIKNHASGITKNAVKLARMARCQRVLSGKPLTQGAHDLYSQLRFIGQQNGVDPTVFKHTFCQMGGFQGKQILGIKNEHMLHDILDRCSFNARKVDWLRTPLPDYGERWINMLPEQERMYRAMQEDFLVELVDGTIVSADQVITKLIKMQQIASGFVIDEEGNTHELMPVAKNPKVLRLKQMLEEEVEHKVIVVAHYQRSLDILGGALPDTSRAVIRGQNWHSKNKVDLVAEKARFNEDDRCSVLLGQEQALRYGHTLMGSAADPCYTTIFYENNYSLNDRTQCEQRNQGAGQLVGTGIIDFLATEKDVAIIKALQRKEDIAAAALNYARETGVLPRKIT